MLHFGALPSSSSKTVRTGWATPTVPIRRPEDIEWAASKGSPWQVRVEFEEGASSKFWMGFGVGRGPVTIEWGKIGRVSQGTQVIDYDEFQKRLTEKVRKGYVVVIGR